MERLNYENGSYHTGPVSVSPTAAPSLAFNLRLVKTVIHYSRIAKRGGYDTETWVESSMAILRLLEEVGVNIEITGMENVESFEGPCVFVANHMSTMETFILPAIIVPIKDATFVVKQGLLNYPVLRHIMRSVGPIAVTRKHPREDLAAVLEGGQRILSQGRSVVVFPQTTRVEGFDPERFNTIGVKLARRAGVPLVPLALKTDAWRVGWPIRDLGRIDPSRKVHFCFGSPMRIKGRGAEEHHEVVSFIAGKLRQWGGTVYSH